MFNNIYSNIKKFIKENIIHIIIFIVFCALALIHLPYTIDAPGGLININERMNIKIKGSYNITFVNSHRASLLKYLYSKINKEWELIPNSDYLNENETIDDDNTREKLLLYNAFSTAYYVAHELANVDPKIIDSNIYVIYVDEDADTNLKIGDKISKLDDIEINDIKDIVEYINEKDVGYKLTVNNDKYIKINEYEDNKALFISVICNYDYDTKIKYEYEKNEYGSSGGFMMALSIYDYLIPYDLTKGRKIAGTGTINLDGTVGEIGGVKQKIITANKNKVDIFFIPEANYKEAKEVILERGYKLNIVSVKNINDAINYLNK